MEYPTYLYVYIAQYVYIVYEATILGNICNVTVFAFCVRLFLCLRKILFSFSKYDCTSFTDTHAHTIRSYKILYARVQRED